MFSLAIYRCREVRGQTSDRGPAPCFLLLATEPLIADSARHFLCRYFSFQLSPLKETKFYKEWHRVAEEALSQNNKASQFSVKTKAADVISFPH
jgi:hypothetical protein